MSKIGWCGDVSGGPWGPMEPPDTGCSKCGSDPDWVDCWKCGGQCEFDLYEEDPLYYRPGDTELCDECDGAGGWDICRHCESNTPTSNSSASFPETK
jgi:hypothetical protein